MKNNQSFGARPTGETIDARGDRTLVRQVTRDAAFVLRTGLADVRSVVDQTVLWRVALGLQGSATEEESLRERCFGVAPTGRAPSQRRESEWSMLELWRDWLSYRRER